jgi:hypothetical protein
MNRRSEQASWRSRLAIAGLLLLVILGPYLYLSREHVAAGGAPERRPSGTSEIVEDAGAEIKVETRSDSGDGANNGKSSRGAVVIGDFETAQKLADIWKLIEASADERSKFDLRVGGLINDECASTSAIPGLVDAHSAAVVGTNPEKKLQIEAAAKWLTGRCEGVTASKELALQYYSEAALAGDIYSRVRLAREQSVFDKMSGEELAGLVNSAIKEGDPDSLLELANILGLRSSGRQIDSLPNELYGNASSGYAWEIAACRLGANCGPSSVRMTQMCALNGACGYLSLDHLYSAEALTPSQWAEVQRMVPLILQLFRI